MQSAIQHRQLLFFSPLSFGFPICKMDPFFYLLHVIFALILRSTASSTRCPSFSFFLSRSLFLELFFLPFLKISEGRPGPQKSFCLRGLCLWIIIMFIN